MQYLVSQCSNSIFHQHVTVKKKKKVSNPCWWSWLTTAKAELFNLNFLLCPMMSPWCNNVQISCCFSISASLPYRQYRGLRIWVLGPSCNTGMRRTGMFKLNSCLSIDSMQTCHFRPNRCDVSVVNWHCERVCECASVRVCIFSMFEMNLCRLIASKIKAHFPLNQKTCKRWTFSAFKGAVHPNWGTPRPGVTQGLVHRYRACTAGKITGERQLTVPSVTWSRLQACAHRMPLCTRELSLKHLVHSS